MAARKTKQRSQHAPTNHRSTSISSPHFAEQPERRRDRRHVRLERFIRMLGVCAATLAVVPVVASAAADGPGASSHFDFARKDCLGTARNTTSKVWYTLADGVLSDVYSPTIDNTNLKSLQFIVTDGSTFTDLQSRDMTYTVNATDRSGMACRATYTDNNGRYRLTATYITDPARDSVLLQTRLQPLGGASANDYQVYVRYDATINGNGGGGADNGGADSATANANALVSYDTTPASEAVNRDYAVPLYGALRASRPFLAVASGFVGTASDGLVQLDQEHQLASNSADAQSGNVVQTARIDVPASGRFTLALGFGQTRQAAVATAGASVATPFITAYRDYLAGWRDYDQGLNPPPDRLPGLSLNQNRALARAYWLSANVLKASEDKTYPGAIVASLASPWGQAVSAASASNGQPVYFGSYREVFSRDLYQAFTGLLAAGDRETARATVRFLFESQQQADGRMPRNSLLNGQTAPDTGGDQLDETSLPILMAWQAGLGGDAQLYENHIKPAADFVVARGPSFGVERWEEQSGYSPSTIASEIAGLIAAAKIAEQNNDARSARIYRATADYFQRSIKQWTVTGNGPLSNGRYFIRLSRNGDPDAATSYNLGNGSIDADQRAVIDAGFLELSRLGILPATDPDIIQSLDVVDQVLKVDTASGPGFYRYGTAATGSEDGYGDCWQPDPTDCTPTGSPWPPSNTGSGHLWPVLSGERAEHEIQIGDRQAAADLLWGMLAFSSGIGLVPEQAWEDPDLAAAAYGSDPETASIGYRNGQPAGSAAPLTWAQAQFLRLMPAVASGQLVEQPAAVAERYLASTPQVIPVSITAPTKDAVIKTRQTQVTGTSTPGARVTVQATNTNTGKTETIATTADDSGAFSVTVESTFGSEVITAAAGETSNSASGYAQVRFASDAISGTTLLDVTDPVGDDNGPGTYAYPSAADFYPGAFDLTRFSVIDRGDQVAFRINLKALQPTFGSVIGAQMLDIYIRNPNASAFSTAAAYDSRNYHIADDSAWSARIEVQGFADPVFVGADNHALPGPVSVAESQQSGSIIVSIPKASLGGTPSSGWKINVVLTGQDGNSSDQARGFAATPEPYLFGVCASADVANRLCYGLNPDAAPKAMDIITPDSVNQADELNALLNGRVELMGVEP